MYKKNIIKTRVIRSGSFFIFYLFDLFSALLFQSRILAIRKIIPDTIIVNIAKMQNTNKTLVKYETKTNRKIRIGDNADNEQYEVIIKSFLIVFLNRKAEIVITNAESPKDRIKNTIVIISIYISFLFFSINHLRSCNIISLIWPNSK
ncbi:Hypothetical protein, predicted transmembrane protein [Mycoplasmopsis arginini 7264]|nr:Hypothetical protein, predicted transmembrane protein [Mycoplasmopsis arginini 7264]